MKKWSLLVIFLLLLLTLGCAMHYNVPMVNVAATPPDIIKKTPLNVAIHISDQMENYTGTAQDEADLLGTKYTFPLGQIIKKNAFDILSPAFNKTTVVKSEPYPQGTDTVLIPKFETFQLRLPPDGFSRQAVAKISIKFFLFDLSGRPIWEETISSSEITGKKSFMGEQGLLEATGSVAAESVVVVLQKAAEAITSSDKVHTFIASKGLSEKIAQKPAAKETPVITSDIETPPAASIKPNKNAYAIVIGIEQYRQKLPKADFATQDAMLVADYLVKAMGYPEENVITLLNDRALKSDFEKYFEKWLGNNVEKDSTVFVYFSGHGAPNPRTGDAYLVPYDGDPSFIDQTGYSLKRMYEALGKLPARKIVVALDSCFSGAGGRSVLAEGSRPLVMNLQKSFVIPENMIVLAAASGNQISSTYKNKGHGLFTYFMLKAIKNEDIIEPDGSIKLGDLFSYIKPRVERIARKEFNNEQTPQLIGAKKN